MISATILAVFFVPGFFVFVMKLFGRGKSEAVTHAPATEPAAAPVPGE
jgi:multidrug efflux pump